ncbi:MAG: hypothetical protein M0021_06870 [Clostridia bacterium]|nr:hypothetical protein [Clostridia bacterium]
MSAVNMGGSGFKWVTLEELHDEMAPYRNTGVLADQFPGFTGLWCRFFVNLNTASQLNNVVFIAHGPEGCTAATRIFSTDYYIQHHGQGFPHLVSSGMTENQVIMGGEKSLRDTIIEVDREYQPSLIIVFTNCASGLAGDDVVSTTEQVQPQVKAKLLWIPSEGYASCWRGKSIEASIPRYVQLMEKPEKVLKDTVNILGMYRGRFSAKGNRRSGDQDTLELVRYVEALGLKVHRVLLGGDYNYIRSAPQAAANILHFPTLGYPLALEMKKAFGTPYLPQARPIGVEVTGRYIRDLGEFFNRREEAEKLIEQEFSSIRDIWEKTKTMVKGKVALIEGGFHTVTATAQALATARLVRELGMEAYIFNLHPLEVCAKPLDIDYFLSDGCNPKFLNYSYGNEEIVTPEQVCEDLGLQEDEIVCFCSNLGLTAPRGKFDVSRVAMVDTSMGNRALHGWEQGIGYRGTAANCKQITDAIKAAARKNKPSIYGRIYGKFYEFEGMMADAERYSRPANIS